VRGPATTLQIRFHQFGDQRSPWIHPTSCCHQLDSPGATPLLFVYIHGWMTMPLQGRLPILNILLIWSRAFPEVTHGKINVIGVLSRGAAKTLPCQLGLADVWNRKSAGMRAAQQLLAATITNCALLREARQKQVHHCVLMGHSFGGLVLSSTIFSLHPRCQQARARARSSEGHAVEFNRAIIPSHSQLCPIRFSL